jgi:uncharacterized protein YdaU (DUF1376 family)
MSTSFSWFKHLQGKEVQEKKGDLHKAIRGSRKRKQKVDWSLKMFWRNKDSKILLEFII